jgi:hypothetical protein
MSQVPVLLAVVQVKGPPAGLPETAVAVKRAPSGMAPTVVAPVLNAPAWIVIDAGVELVYVNVHVAERFDRFGKVTVFATRSNVTLELPEHANVWV